jgi:hypothetical protein
LCNLPELQLDQIIKKKISNFSTDLFTGIVENAKLRSERWVMNQYRILQTLQPRQPRVVQAGDLIEDAAVIHSALGHQEMEARVKVDPIPKGLDRGYDARRDIFLCHSPEVDGQGVDGTATEVAEEIGISLSLILLLLQNLQ